MKFKNKALVLSDARSRCVRAANSTTFGKTRAAQVSSELFELRRNIRVDFSIQLRDIFLPYYLTGQHFQLDIMYSEYRIKMFREFIRYRRLVGVNIH